jgi:hypothetical protein
MNKAAMKKIVLSFGGVEEGESYGKPAFLLGKKFFTRLRASDDSMVLIVGSIDEREMLLEAEPKLFFITDHYKNYPAVLAHLAKLDALTLRSLLERRWKQIAPKKLQSAGERDKPAPKKPRKISKSKKRS